MDKLGQIKLKGAGFGGTPIVVDVSLPIPVTKSIADIAEPQSRQGAFTKTVTIQGNTDINSAFRHIYEINKDITNVSGQYMPDFNPNKRVEVEYSVEGVVQLDGYMRLLNIKKDVQSSLIIYDCQIFDKAADFWKEIDGKTMAEIDLTKYNHTLNYDAIRKSWDQNIFENGVQIPFAYGTGYVHGLINRRPDSTTAGFGVTQSWDVGDTTPMLYAKELVDYIYEQADTEYVSGGFFDSAEFKRWVVPYNGTGLDLFDSDINDNKVIAATNTNYSVSSGANIIFQDDSPSPLQNINGNYDTSTGVYTCPRNGNYLTIVQGTIRETYFPSSSGNMTNTLLVRVKNITTGQNRGFFRTLNVPNGETTIDFSFVATIENIACDLNDELEIEIRATSSNFVIQQSTSLLSGAELLIKQNPQPYTSGAEVRFENFISKDVKQKDFILDLVKTFNLYIDLDDEGRHIVETRDEYYSDEVVDIEPYLNTAKEVVYEPMGALDANPYEFDYKEGKDILNDYYSGSQSINYGRKRYDVDNDFITKTKKIEVTYSPSVMRYHQDTSMSLVDITFLTKDGKEDKSKKGNYRLLRYEGIKPCNQYAIDDGANVNFMYAYPLIGHINDDTNPTLDGLFGMPLTHFLKSDIKYSNNNLFFQYHLKQYKETTDKNSKLVHGYFNISPDLFPKLKFHKLYYFDNSYFRINKIYDYKPYVDTKIEFIKAIEYTKPASGNSSGNGGQDDSDVFDDFYPSPVSILQPRNNNTRFAIGGNNTLNNDSLAVGYNNIGLGDGQVSLLSSSGNTINENVTQATLINTDDTEITEDGVYIEGKLLSLPTIYSLSADETSESATFASISDWQVPVESGKVYGITIVGYYKGATSNASLNIGQELTTATGNINGLWEVTAASGGLEELQIQNIRLITDAYLGGGVGASDTYFTFKASFNFECTTSGTFGIRFASGNGDLITLRQNSKLQIIEL